MSQRFVHLRLHTEYSLVDSVVRVAALMEAVAAARMPAVALTDASNLFAMVKFYRAALEHGVKPIVGVELTVGEPGDPRHSSRIALLCQSTEGYRNVTRLLSRAYLERQAGQDVLVDRRWLTAADLKGLIALSCATQGDLGRALANGRDAEAARALDFWLELFGDRFYVELQRLGRPDEEAYIAAAVQLAARCGAPVVATNDVRFLAPGDFESHEARVCIQEGSLLADPSRPRRYTAQQYLRTPAEMTALFADVPEALSNSVEIARRCSLALKLGEMRLPEYPVPAGTSAVELLRSQAAEGLEWRRHAGRTRPAAPGVAASADPYSTR